MLLLSCRSHLAGTGAPALQMRSRALRRITCSEAHSSDPFTSCGCSGVSAQTISSIRTAFSSSTQSASAEYDTLSFAIRNDAGTQGICDTNFFPVCLPKAIRLRLWQAHTQLIMPNALAALALHQQHTLNTLHMYGVADPREAHM